MKVVLTLSAVVVVLGLAACARAPATTDANNPSAAAPVQAAPIASAPVVQHLVDETLPSIMVYKSPACGCCEMWVEHMRTAGFQVDVTNTADMAAIKTEAGVPVGMGSCHTAKVGDYYVEGHVPAEDLKRLLVEMPDARGLIVPGMVLGSPGMEQGGVRRSYDVLLLANDGATTIFAHHGG